MALPSGYLELSYLESTGTQYINTNLYGNLNTRFVGKINKVTASSNGTVTIFGDNTTNTSAVSLSVSANSSNRTTRFGNKSFSGTNVLSNNVDYEITFDKEALIANGDTKGTFGTTTEFTTQNVMFLFRTRGIDPNYYSDGRTRIYYAKIYEGNTLVRDFVPAVRLSDGAIGMYDSANSVFYENAGTGTFEYGILVAVDINPTGAGSVTGTGAYEVGDSVSLTATADSGFEFIDWALPESYKRLDYISSDGTDQYIDTGVSPASHYAALRIEGDMAWNVSPQGTSVSQFLFGTGYYSSTTTSRRTICVGYNQAIDTSHMTYLNGAQVGSGVIFTDSVLDTTRRIYGIDQVNKVYIYGDQTQAFTTTVNSNLTKSILIFAYRNSSQSGEPILRHANAKCYGFKIWSNDTLIRNFIPVKRTSDNALGLFDLVNFKFYENAGTGSFTYGSETGDLIFTDNPLSFTASLETSYFIANFKRTANCRFKVNGEWVTGMMYKKVNGEWVTGEVYVKVNGVWEKLVDQRSLVLNTALSTLLGNDVSVRDPNVALNIIMRGE